MVTGETNNPEATFQASLMARTMNVHLEVGGKPYSVTAERLPNGRIAIRANGRIVAPPQPENAIDCRIVLGATPFHVSGNGDELRVDPVIVVPAASPSPPPQTTDPIQLRAVVFIVLGSLTVVAASCLLFGTAGSHLDQAGQAEIESDPVMRTAVLMNSAMRFAVVLQACVGAAAIAGGAMLVRRMRSSLVVLDVASWCVVGAPALCLLVIDILAHRQIEALPDPGSGMPFLRALHVTAFVALVILGVIAGVLSSFVDRDAMAARL
jgi:hypothetical protein